MPEVRRHLFGRWPRLREKLPWQPLADLPSPVEKLEHLGDAIGTRDLWIKRDDLNSDLYSGNKPRKFEFIFADAAARGCREVMTMGSAGSNHAAATCLFCQKLGYRPVLALTPQPVLSYVRENILVDHACDPVYLFAGNEAGAVIRMAAYHRRQAKATGCAPYFMYFGGSSVLGNVGFVDAGLELADQIRQGVFPKPRFVFVATGSCGTHAGLLVGLRAAGMSDIRVVGVRIVPKIVTNKLVVAIHANLTAAFLRHRDPTFPAMHFRARDIDLLDDFFGGQYGRPTPEGKAAIKLAAATENLPLDPTYTGKAAAGMVAFFRQHDLCKTPILYWHTRNGAPLEPWAARVTPDQLPPTLRAYFERPLYDPEL